MTECCDIEWRCQGGWRYHGNGQAMSRFAAPWKIWRCYRTGRAHAIATMSFMYCYSSYSYFYSYSYSSLSSLLCTAMTATRGIALDSAGADEAVMKRQECYTRKNVKKTLFGGPKRLPAPHGPPHTPKTKKKRK